MARKPISLICLFFWIASSCGPFFPFSVGERYDVGFESSAPSASVSLFETISNEQSQHVISATEPFTIIALPDTQEYSRHYPEIFEAQTKWIVENKTRLNIIYVFHLGDIVDSADYPPRENEWVNASRAMSLLDGVVPYGVLPGNHDMDKQGVANWFNQYFPVAKFQQESWWGGHYLGNKNNYQLISVPGMDFIMLNLEYEPSPDVLVWAKGILDAYQDRVAIIATHFYLTSWGTVLDHPHENWRTNGVSSKAIRDQLVAKSKNVMMVLCGHFWGEAASSITENASGKPVFALMSDYQFLANGGSGYLRILRFLPKEQRISVETYSPWLDKNRTASMAIHLRDQKHEFEVCFGDGTKCLNLNSVPAVPQKE